MQAAEKILHVIYIICTVLISGRSYCSFSLLHYSSYYTYCSKKMWIVLLIFITVLLFLLYVLFSKTRPVTFINTGLIVGTFITYFTFIHRNHSYTVYVKSKIIRNLEESKPKSLPTFYSMTQLLLHTFAHLTGPSFRL